MVFRKKRRPRQHATRTTPCAAPLRQPNTHTRKNDGIRRPLRRPRRNPALHMHRHRRCMHPHRRNLKATAPRPLHRRRRRSLRNHWPRITLTRSRRPRRPLTIPRAAAAPTRIPAAARALHRRRCPDRAALTANQVHRQQKHQDEHQPHQHARSLGIHPRATSRIPPAATPPSPHMKKGPARHRRPGPCRSITTPPQGRSKLSPWPSSRPSSEHRRACPHT